ncbi:MAG: DUF6526 family protein [Acidobacteria bacterium]|nr:DUF6526 family protein [Acidobacteriota bacterium]
MAAQSFKSHTKWDPLFHFVISPILLVNVILAVRHAWAYPAYTTIVAVVLAVALFLLAFKMRLYSLKVQDRLIRLEERLRLQGQLPAADLSRLSESQLVGLRFASDEEVVALAQKALAGSWTQKQIKAAIKTWRPDHFRV